MRPMKLPEPILSLANMHGGLDPLAQLLGVHRSTIRRWGLDLNAITPSYKNLINHELREAGLPSL